MQVLRFHRKFDLSDMINNKFMEFKIISDSLEF